MGYSSPERFHIRALVRYVIVNLAAFEGEKKVRREDRRFI